MSSIDKAIADLEKIISHLEEVTGVPAVPQQKQKKAQPAKKADPLANMPPIVQDFAKCDLHVTQILECKNVDFSDKLLLMKLKVNEKETRTFAAGVAHWYKPEDLINKKIVTILNLKPRPMAEGKIVSEAMLFAGSYGENGQKENVRLCFPDQSVEVGTRVVIEGYENLPAAEGQPKKHFDRVGEALKAKDKCMALDGMKLIAGGKYISVDVPDGAHLG